MSVIPLSTNNYNALSEVYNKLYHDSRFGDITLYMFRPEFAGQPKPSPKELDAWIELYVRDFVYTLALSNKKAYADRYREKMGDFKMSDIKPYLKKDRMPISNIAMVKRLQAIRYNISDEGETWKKLHDKINELLFWYYDLIVSRMPEYEKAPWTE